MMRENNTSDPFLFRISPAAAVLLARAFLLALIFGWLVLAPLAALMIGTAYFRAYGPVAPGVRSAGIDLGGMTVEQAALVLHQTWNLEHSIRVTEGKHSWAISPSELGIELDVLAAAQAAHRIGRGPGFWSTPGVVWRTYRQGVEIAPVVKFSPAAARQALERLAPEASVPARNASLRLEGERLVSVPAELGFTIDVAQSLATLEAAPEQALFGGLFVAAMQPVAPEVTDVSAALAEAEALLNMSLTIRAYDAVANEYLEWTLPRQQLIGWLQIDAGPNGLPVVSLNTTGFEPYLQSVSDSLAPQRRLDLDGLPAFNLEDLRAGGFPVLNVLHAPTSHTVQAGDTLISIAWKVGMPYWKLIAANPGLDPDALRPGQSLVVPSKDELLPYPVVRNKRIVVSLSQQRMYLYEDGDLVKEYVVSTGIASSPTQPGIFQIQTHEKLAYASVWDLYMPNFIGIYEAWPGFMNGIHGLPTLSNGQRLWANVLGRPASYGCIILDLPASDAVFEWAEQGVVIEIR
jgi:LysM repeat protein